MLNQFAGTKRAGKFVPDGSNVGVSFYNFSIAKSIGGSTGHCRARVQAFELGKQGIVARPALDESLI